MVRARRSRAATRRRGAARRRAGAAAPRPSAAHMSRPAAPPLAARNAAIKMAPRRPQARPWRARSAGAATRMHKNGYYE